MLKLVKNFVHFFMLYIFYVLFVHISPLIIIAYYMFLLDVMLRMLILVAAVC